MRHFTFSFALIAYLSYKRLLYLSSSNSDVDFISGFQLYTQYIMSLVLLKMYNTFKLSAFISQ